MQIRRLLKTGVDRPGLGHGPNSLKTTAVRRPNQIRVGELTYVRVRIQIVFVTVLMNLNTRTNWRRDSDGTLDANLAREALEEAF